MNSIGCSFISWKKKYDAEQKEKDVDKKIENVMGLEKNHVANVC